MPVVKKSFTMSDTLVNMRLGRSVLVPFFFIMHRNYRGRRACGGNGWTWQPDRLIDRMIESIGDRHDDGAINSPLEGSRESMLAPVLNAATRRAYNSPHVTHNVQTLFSALSIYDDGIAGLKGSRLTSRLRSCIRNFVGVSMYAKYDVSYAV